MGNQWPTGVEIRLASLSGAKAAVRSRLGPISFLITCVSVTIGVRSHAEQRLAFGTWAQAPSLWADEDPEGEFARPTSQS